MQVIKIGGSLLSFLKEIVDIVTTAEDSIIIPGGGCFADHIRDFAQKVKLHNAAAHKMAIYAMHQYGIYMSYLSGIPYATKLDQLSSNKIFFPYDILEKYDPFPYSWDVTSDSITVFIAHLLDIRNVKLIKANTDIVIKGSAIKEINTQDLKDVNQSITDKYFPTCMERYQVNCEIYNAKNLSTFKKRFNSNKYDLKIRVL